MKESDLSVHCRIEVSDAGWKVDALRLKGLVTSALNLMRPEMGAIPGMRRAVGVSCYFVPSTEIRDLNRDLRGIDAVADMLSFPLGYAMPGTGWILGDIVFSTPFVVQSPSLAAVPSAAVGDCAQTAGHSCSGGCDCSSDCVKSCYYCFRECNKTRKKVVYVGGNDGMLHAVVAGIWYSDRIQRRRRRGLGKG